MEAVEVTLEGIKKDISYIKVSVTEIKDTIKKDYVTKVEFDPIKKIVYGLVSIVLASVFIAVLSMVIK